MIAFFSFIFTLSFTPGPNTLMSMNEGQKKGFRGGLPFNLGVLLGFVFIGLILGIFTHLFVRYKGLVLILKIIGTLYLLYLSWHLATAKKAAAVKQSSEHPVLTGFLLQLTNIKVYLYYITALTSFAVFSTPVKEAILAVVGVLGTLLWLLAGQMIQRFYFTYFRAINIGLALLLVYSAVDLWI